MAPHRPWSEYPSLGRHRGVSVPALAGTVALLALLLFAFLPIAAATAGSPPTATLSHPALLSAPSETAAVAPAAARQPARFSPPCAPVINGVCVSIQNPGEPNIVPTPPSYTASVEPSATTNLPLWVKSATPLNWTYNSHSGPDSPIALNVTGTLWNGVPYYSQYDGSTFHSANAGWWTGPVLMNDPTYPYWYLVNISANTIAGKPAFFPGMEITWWIEITFNVSGNYIHQNGPQYHYTYDGAWPYSPYQGTSQYAGSAAFFSDLTLRTSPNQPNWNDSFHLTLNTTPGDAAVNASLNAVFIDLKEVSANGTPLLTTTFVNDPSNSTRGIGYGSLKLTIPASFAQEAGATIKYTLHASDAWGDWVTSPARTYTVGGNGSFIGLGFANDLSLTTNPGVGLAPALPPGAPVSLLLVSQQSGVAIASATVFYSVHLPVLSETARFSAPFARVNSTTFTGSIPGLPVGVGVNFSVTAWDFSSTGESSPVMNFSVLPLTTLLPSIAQNDSFFYVGIHDGSSNTWVSGAAVSIAGPGGYVASRSTTVAGLAYPGQATNPLAPIVVPAGATYNINVSDPALGYPYLNVPLAATHSMRGHSVLVSAPNYAVIQDGNLVVFWLNSTLAPPVVANSDLTPILVGSGIGLAATGLVVLPLMGWWRRIQKRREEELRRVTL